MALTDGFIILLVIGFQYVNYYYKVIVHINAYDILDVLITLLALISPNISLIMIVILYFLLTSYDFVNSVAMHKRISIENRIFRKILRVLIIIIMLLIVTFIFVILMYILQNEFQHRYDDIANFLKKYRNFGIVVLLYTVLHDIINYSRNKCTSISLDSLLKVIINSIYSMDISKNLRIVINKYAKDIKTIDEAIKFLISLRDYVLHSCNDITLYHILTVYIQELKFNYSNNKNTNMAINGILFKSLFEIILIMFVIFKIWRYKVFLNFFAVALILISISIPIVTILFISINCIIYQRLFINKNWFYSLKYALGFIKHNIL